MTDVETSPSPPQQADHPDSGRGIGYLPGLDGLRAISILAVIAYHLDASWAAGGYLGVEVFFVISGYLITLLAIDERARTGALDRVRFWGRRARRLLPAVIVLVVAVLAWSAIGLPEGELRRFRGDALASLLYVQNWHSIFTDQPYFEAFNRPSPFRHLWSLSIEEQFYLLWPMVLPLLWRGRDDAKVARWLLAGAGISMLLMSALVDVSAPERVYYGTDARAFGILIGAALAFVWRPHRARVDVVEAARRTLGVAGVAAMALLAWQFAHRSEFDTWTYPWGFVWVDLLTVIAIVSATHPASPFAAQIGSAAMAAIGRRSYSLYLWHWPVIVCTRPGVDWGLEGRGALLGRVALIVVLSELSYRFVEQPFRDGRAQRIWDNLRVRATREGWWAAAAVVATAILVAGASTVAAAPRADEEAGRQRPTEITVGPAPTTTAIPSTTAAPTTVPATAPAPTTTAAPATTAPRPVPDVTIVGESVTLGGAGRLQELYGQRVQIDAAEGRSFDDGVARIEALSAEGRLTPYVVVHMGNNGVVPGGALERIVAAVGPDRRLVFVNVRVPRRWEQQVNGELARIVGQTPNAQLVDWNAVANNEPGLLTSDGVHLTKAGEERYAALLTEMTP